MTTTPTLNEYISTHQTGDPDETVVAVFDAMALPDNWRQMFYRVVRDECRRQARTIVRDMESGQHVGDTQEANAAPMSRTAYLAERFYNGTEWVLWATATVDDHQGRIDSQTRLWLGISADIERHRQAITEIRAAGVTCLAEIVAVAA